MHLEDMTRVTDKCNGSHQIISENRQSIIWYVTRGMVRQKHRFACFELSRLF
jgi:hypothetical protein